MLQAIALTEQSKWDTAPNPPVGALLVKDGQILASGRHMAAGLPHAEAAALEDARQKNIDPAGCTLVVTLEPCTHHGKTPPCSEAILNAGIKHVVIGTLDPNPKAAGGAEMLRSKGVQVETGIAEEACLDLIDNFVTWQTTEYPYTVLKLASTMDGRIATRTGHSKWITSPETLLRVHELRRHMQAIIVGGNTFYQDDPRLTCRLEDGTDCSPQPLAVVVTSRLPAAGASYHLLQNRPQDTIFWTTVAAAASPKAEALRRIGVRVIGLSSSPKANTRGYGMRAELNLEEGLRNLRQECGCYHALCEGGGRLGLAFLNRGLTHELHLHLAPKILGDNEATPLFDGLAPLTMDDALALRITDARNSGQDIMLTMRPRTRNTQEAQSDSPVEK